MNVPAIIFGGLAGMAVIVAIWFGVEALLLATGRAPITFYVRNFTSWEPGPATLVVFAIAFTAGAAIAHFMWDIRK